MTLIIYPSVLFPFYPSFFPCRARRPIAVRLSHAAAGIHLPSQRAWTRHSIWRLLGCHRRAGERPPWASSSVVAADARFDAMAEAEQGMVMVRRREEGARRPGCCARGRREPRRRISSSSRGGGNVGVPPLVRRPARCPRRGVHPGHAATLALIRFVANLVVHLCYPSLWMFLAGIAARRSDFWLVSNLSLGRMQLEWRILTVSRFS
jgi:hypothetical protein